MSKRLDINGIALLISALTQSYVFIEIHNEKVKIDPETGQKLRDQSNDMTPGQIWTITEFKMGAPHGEWKYY